MGRQRLVSLRLAFLRYRVESGRDTSHGLRQVGLGWVVLDLVGLGCVGLGWIEIVWIGLGLDCLSSTMSVQIVCYYGGRLGGSVPTGWIGLGKVWFVAWASVGMSWVQLDWVALEWPGNGVCHLNHINMYI